MLARNSHGSPPTTAAAAIAILALIVIVYWPVRQGGFVWDDQLCFHDAAWLRQSEWTRYLFRGFCDWTDYFRPLVVALYALQVRSFDSAPGPMHLVSLGLHLINTLLVGVLALKVTRLKVLRPSPFAAATVMAIYGLHPLLIEPVFWIGCQYEMVVTLWTLVGLLCNVAIPRPGARALVVAACFFFAACAKESAMAFPLLLVVFDIGMTPAEAKNKVRATWRRQWPVYSCVLAAGLLYLALRHWAIGASATPLAWQSFLSPAHWQKAALAYLEYWKLLVWPMTGLGPIHPVAEERFSTVTMQTLSCDVAALAIVFCGLLLLHRGRPLGALILSVTAALLPVLHIVPIPFNESLYHERYAMTALAVAGAWLPAAAMRVWLWMERRRSLRRIMFLVILAWLVIAIANIRVTLPLWSDELALWQWAVRENPGSLVAEQHLLAKYVERNDRAHASALAHALVAEHAQCPVCMLEIALFGAGDGDIKLAAAAIESIRNDKAIPGDPLFLQEFVLAQGELLELQHDPKNAAAAYRDAIELDPLDARPRMNLALLHLRLGEVAQARAIAETALSLYAPDERGRRRTAFEQAVEAVSRQQTPRYPAVEPPSR